MKKLLSVLFAVLIALCACACSVDTTATIAKDGKVSVKSVLTMQKNDTTDEYVTLLKSDLPKNTKITTVTDNGKKQYKITQTQSFKSSTEFAKSLKGTDTDTTSSETTLGGGLFSTVTVTTKTMYGRIYPEYTESLKMLADTDVDTTCTYTVKFPYKITKTNLTKKDDYTVTFDCLEVADKDIYVITEKTNYEKLFKSLNDYNNRITYFYVKSANLANDNNLKLSWTPSKNAVLYTVYYRECGKKKYVQCDFTYDTSTVIYDLVAGKTYKLKIVAENSEGKTFNAYTGYISTLKKNKLTATAAKKSAKLSWTRDKNADGYQIYMAKGNGDFKLAKTINKSATIKYTKTSLTGGKKYTFKVRSYKLVNNKKVYGDFSAEKTVTAKKK